MHKCTVINETVQSLQTERKTHVVRRELDDDSDGAQLTSIGMEFLTEDVAYKTNDYHLSPYCMQAY